MKITLTKDHAKHFGLIILGTLLFAVGINFFAIPNKLSEGGVIGLTIVAFYYFNWSPGILNLILNAILMVIGYKLLDKRTIIYTIFGIFFSSLFLYLTENELKPLTSDPLLAAIFSGVLVGGGIGLVFLSGGTTGGSAIIARLFQKFWGWKLGTAMLIVDIVVIALSAFIIGPENTMYTLIAVYVGARVVDFIIEGFNTKKAVTIISTEAAQISAKITEGMFRGATILHGSGAYTKNPKEVIYVVISKPELMELKRAIHELDPMAFVVIHDVHDVFGRGFTLS